MNISIEENKFYGYVYDGIWAIALALNRVDSLLKHYNHLARSGKVKLKPEMEGIMSLLDFEYHKPVWVRLIREALNKTRFNGVTVSLMIILRGTVFIVICIKFLLLIFLLCWNNLNRGLSASKIMRGLV